MRSYFIKYTHAHALFVRRVKLVSVFDLVKWLIKEYKTDINIKFINILDK